jgi:hypothetical protein
MPLEPLICRSRYVKIQLTFPSLKMLTGFNYKLRKKLIVNKCYKNRRIFGESKKYTYICNVQKNKSINRSVWNNKNLKIMAATNWTIVTRRSDDNVTDLFPLTTKMTYKTALAIANETIKSETFELICVVETSKILLKNDKKTEKTK